MCKLSLAWVSFAANLEFSLAVANATPHTKSLARADAGEPFAHADPEGRLMVFNELIAEHCVVMTD